MNIHEVEFGSASYLQTLSLRKKILRDPLGLQFSAEDLAQENKYFHLGAFKGDLLLGCLILTKMDSNSLKMRQVAVDFEVQGRGIGKQLVVFSEKFATKRGFKYIKLSARDTAVPFYMKLGYKTVGAVFVEVSIPHQQMEKTLGGNE
jgi:predicted GNAT family N-acyltransferase